MKSKWNIFIWLFVILVIINTIRGFFSEMVVTETVRQGKLEESYSKSGVIIKYETLYSSDARGTAEAHVSEGDKVGRGDSLVDVFNGNVDETLISKLARVNERIAVINENRLGNEIFTNDVVKIEGELDDCIDKIIKASTQKNIAEVASLKHRIAVLADRKAVVTGVKDSSDNTLEQLMQEKQAIESQINAVRHSIRSTSAGIFSHYLDGFEEVITPYNMHEFSPSALNDICAEAKKEQRKESDYICKVVDNFRYFIAVPVPADYARDLEIGESITLRFPELSANSFPAQVQAISEVTAGEVSVVFETNRHVDSLILKRTANVEIIKSKYQGFKISLSSIKTKDGVNGVYAAREGSMHFIPIEILYNTDETVIVKSKDNENPLKLYDEIIVKANSYEEGKTVRS